MPKLQRTLARVEDSASNDEIIERWQSGLRFDKNNLDTEMEIDAYGVGQVGDAFALACERRDELKIERDETHARLYLKFRAEAETKGTKATETTIQSMIDLSDEAQEIRRSYLIACTFADRLEAQVRAYHVRSAHIRAEGELYKVGYFTINNHVRANADTADRASTIANKSKGFGKGAAR